MPSTTELDDIAGVADPVERGRALGDYLGRLDELVVEARKRRRAAIAEHLAADPDRGKRPSTVAQQFGVSVSLVKNVRDGRA